MNRELATRLHKQTIASAFGHANRFRRRYNALREKVNANYDWLPTAAEVLNHKTFRIKLP